MPHFPANVILNATEILGVLYGFYTPPWADWSRMKTRLTFYNTIPIDLMLCRMDDKNVEAKITIWQSALLELLGNVELEDDT